MSNLFCQAKISYPNVTLSVHEYIFWLDVSKHDVPSMQVLEAKQDLTDVKLSQLLRESSLLIQMEEKLTSSAQIKNKKQFIVALEGPVQLDEKCVL